ncbi:MAG: hypothetical protein WCF84_01770, partial [Anaerolineae bacterium]
VWNQQAGGWQKVAERLDNRDPVTLAWAPVQTQYINIQLLQPASRPWAIRELQVTRTMTDWVSPS